MKTATPTAELVMQLLDTVLKPEVTIKPDMAMLKEKITELIESTKNHWYEKGKLEGFMEGYNGKMNRTDC